MGRPLIGVSCRLETGKDNGWFYLQREYCEAVWANGGLPVQIPLIADSEYTEQLVARLDGIVLSGSASDVNPKLYGEPPHEKVTQIHGGKDETDIRLVRLAIQSRKPLLGICFGTQAMNVALGGTLVQHLETALVHPDPTPDRRNRHTVRVAPDSVLAKLGGQAEEKVNSSHHQAIRNVGSGLRVTAWADEQVIEAVETTDPNRFLVGVQWHPERIWQESQLSKALFEELVRQSSSGGRS